MRRVYGGRALLNLPGHHSTAAIVAEVESTAGWAEGEGRGGDELTRYTALPTIQLQITDCDSKVNIEFDIDTPNSLENSIHKVDTMIEVLREFKKGLKAEGPRAQKRIASIPAERRYGL